MTRLATGKSIYITTINTVTKQIYLLTLNLLFQHYGPAQGLEWAFKTGGSLTDVGYAVVADKNDYIYTTGNFENGGDFDPGPGAANLSSSGSTDIFIQKLTTGRKLVWARKIGGNGADSGNGIAVDQQGNIYLTGYFSNSMDADPGPMSFFISSFGEWDIFVIKLDKNGKLLWAASAGSSGTDSGLGVDFDPLGNVYVTGYFTGTANFDPGGSNFTLTSTGGSRAFVWKLDTNGKFVWATGTGGTNQFRGWTISNAPDGSLFVGGDGFLQKRDAGGNLIWNLAMTNTGSATTRLLTDRSGNVITTGYFTGSFLLTDTTLTNNSSTTFILKLDPEGKCLMCRTITGSSIIWGYDIDTDAEGNIYTTGWFSGDVDLDPGPGTAILSAPNDYGSFVVKMDATGTFKWAVPFQGTGPGNRAEAYSTVVDNHGGIYSVGRFRGTVDLDPGTGMFNVTANGFFDYFFTKISSRVFYRGKVFHDLNDNKQQDAGEPNLPNMIVNARENDIYVSSDEDGLYRFYADVFADTIRIVPPQPYWSATPAFQVATMQAPADFAMTFDTVRDICLSVIAVPSFRPGRKTKVHLNVSNIGSVRIDSIPVNLRVSIQPVPEPLIYLSSQPEVSAISGDLYSWLIPSLSPGKTAYLEINFQSPLSAALGSPVVLSSFAFIPNDVQPDNNLSRVSYIVQVAKDPNDKQVTPDIVAPEALDTTSLIYVVRFQNTGNYPAELIFLRDTLPPEIDPGSLMILGTSHAPYTWQLSEGRELEVRFDPIWLPDSVSNEPESHGFVAFSLKPRPGLILGDSVRNRVGIYFDYNEPVITNYAVMKIAQLVQVSETGAFGGLAVKLSPNPVTAHSPVWVDLPAEAAQQATQAVVSDIKGFIVQKIAITPGERHLKLDGLPAGIYWVRVSAGSMSGGRLLIVH